MSSARDTPDAAVTIAADSHAPLPLIERPHTLYRFYTAADALLYVGITAALPTRLGNHRDNKPWWTTATRITLTHYPDRDSVLEAERHAIKTERPLHNVVHNGGGAPPRPVSGSFETTGIRPGEQAWTFSSRYGHTRTVPLTLFWEVHCDPISDDWYIDDISPAELWRLWLTRYPRDERAEARYGAGAFRILWFVEGPGTFEGAPFAEVLDPSPYDQNFLTHFTWPVNSQTREPLLWSRLPVIDKVWRRDNLPTDYETKGGFIQEATGWKPAPLQPYVNVHQLARMARLYCPKATR